MRQIESRMQEDAQSILPTTASFMVVEVEALRIWEAILEIRFVAVDSRALMPQAAHFYIVIRKMENRLCRRDRDF